MSKVTTVPAYRLYATFVTLYNDSSFLERVRVGGVGGVLVVVVTGVLMGDVRIKLLFPAPQLAKQASFVGIAA